MTYTVLENAIIYHGNFDDGVPNIFGTPVKCLKTDNTHMYLIHRNHMVDMYIISGCDERFPPEIMERVYNENNC